MWYWLTKKVEEVALEFSIADEDVYSFVNMHFYEQV